MTWLQALSESYDNYSIHIGKEEKVPLVPIFHTTQNADIEIILNTEGEIQKSRLIEDNKVTVIPCTEESSSRTSGKTPHPLCDRLEYVAGDYEKFFNLETNSFYQAYLKLLGQWCSSPFSHPKVQAVYKYVSKGTLVTDLCNNKTLSLPDNIEVLVKNKDFPTKAFVRWLVRVEDDPEDALWNDKLVIESWIKFYDSLQQKKGLCYVSGKIENLAKLHPKKILHSADGAKLISSNDERNFTYRGRFSTSEQVYGVSYQTSHKAHSALRWLIAKQGYRDGSLAIVAWHMKCKKIFNPLENSKELCESTQSCNDEGNDDFETKGHTGEHCSKELRKRISGYTTKLSLTELTKNPNMVIIALDSASPGRASLLCYRRLSEKDYLLRLEKWHTHCCWMQRYEYYSFEGAPSPIDIAKTAYGKEVNQELRKKIVREILMCIIDGMPIPIYLLQACFNRTIQRHGLDQNEWKKLLGITCALFRKYYFDKNQRNYQMTLELELLSRDYLYGRLLAIAEHIEYTALPDEEKSRRMTNAARLMYRFANYPFETWRTIELSLIPYRERLISKKPGIFIKLEKEMDSIMSAFKREEFISSEKLTAEFLLGYHCQKEANFKSKEIVTTTETN